MLKIEKYVIVASWKISYHAELLSKKAYFKQYTKSSPLKRALRGITDQNFELPERGDFLARTFNTGSQGRGFLVVARIYTRSIL